MTPHRAGNPPGPWPAIVVVLIALHTAGMMWLIAVAGSDPSMAVEPGYDARALRWDEERTRRAASDELGWRAAASVGGAAVDGHGRGLLVILTDRAGAAVENATVTAEWFHQARAADRRSATLTGAGAGRYEAPAPILRPGVWEVRVTATRGGEAWSGTVTMLVGPTGARP